MSVRVGLAERLRNGRPVIGAWCSLDSSFPAEIASRTGFDYVCVDLQHGLAEYASLVPALQGIAAGEAAPVVRVPQNESWMIMKALDMGANGIIVPLVDSVAMATEAVEAMRYPPAGRRSYGPTRAGLVVGDPSPPAQETTACIVMVESAAALDRVEEIAAVPGVDAIYIGPADLSLSLGLPLPGPQANTRLEEAASRVLEATSQAGIAAGFHCTDGAAARERLAQGFQMVTVASDVMSIRRGFASELRAAIPDAGER